MKLSALVSGLVDGVEGAGDPEIEHLTIDINEVRPGTLFAARRQWYGDTHEHLEEAVRRGAAALLVSDAARAPTTVPVAVARAEDPALGLVSRRYYDAPSSRLEVYGVTGTNGKTTVTWMIAHILAALGERPALMGTLGYRFEDAIVPASNTTPDALVIHRFAADAAARGATALVLEVSSHALAIGRVAGVCFDSVGFTNLSHDHLDFHRDEGAYFAAKRQLFDQVRRESRAWGKSPAGVVCVDDAAGRRLYDESSDVRGVATGNVAETGLWRVHETGHGGLEGMSAVLSTAGERHSVDLPMVGDFNLANAGVAAGMVAVTHPEAEGAVWAALADFGGVPGRLEQVIPGVFVDYAHTPAAVARAASTIRRRSTAPMSIVVGCGGARDRIKRPLMAQRAAEAADHLILTSDNPRDEAPEAIIDDMVVGLSGPYTRAVDRTDAISQALSRGGVTLVAGKGHERYQEAGGCRWHFDDREEVRRCHRALSEGLDSEDAPLWWGWADVPEAPSTLASRAIREAKARPGGLWVVVTADFAAAVVRARLCVGPEEILVGEYPRCGAMLTRRHRILIASLELPSALSDVGAEVSDLDWEAAYAANEVGRERLTQHPMVPTLGPV